MKDILKGTLIYLLAVLTIAGIMLISDMNKPTTQAVVPCPLCAEACEIFHTTRVESKHRETPNYYYYTYKCKACGNEFTLEIVQE